MIVEKSFTLSVLTANTAAVPRQCQPKAEKEVAHAVFLSIRNRLHSSITDVACPMAKPAVKQKTGVPDVLAIALKTNKVV
ncbi:MAG: hypothetical protein ACRDCI_08615 [Plesiomonas shigelloides]